jgi:hypothetical protein
MLSAGGRQLVRRGVWFQELEKNVEKGLQWREDYSLITGAKIDLLFDT